MDEDLNSSVLGSHEFWDNFYSDEIENYKDHGDAGEVWFGKDAERRIVKWIYDNPDIEKDDAILDLGCGNGMLLINLSEKGFCNLHGIDYSKNAIQLAKAVSNNKNCFINFFEGNIMEYIFCSLFRVILDKGTYDAISLDPEDSKSKKQVYVKRISEILKENGYFIIASCNWTKDELLKQFSDLDHVETLPAPTFQFGGKTGNSVTTVVFKKR